MAEKKHQSQAEKAANEAKKKSAGSGSSANQKTKTQSPKAAAKKSEKAEKKAKVKTEYEMPIPNSVIIALLSLGLFVLFLVTAIKPDGALLKVIRSVVMGLIGQAGFYFSIPVLLYLFMIHSFGRKTKVTMRSICALIFLLLCGCIYHLTVQTQGMAKGMALIADLYVTGVSGGSGGVLCGGVSMLLRWACGNVMSYILLIVAAILFLHGAMQITIPSIIRAIANRPREEWDDEEEEEDYIEPAAVVVNHIANKQLEYKRQRRQRMEEERQQMLSEPAAPVLPEPRPHRPEPAAQLPVPAESNPSRASDFMSRVDEEISAPVGAAAEPVREEVRKAPAKKAAPSIPVLVEGDELEEDFIVPSKMPELDPSAPIPPAPKPKMTEEAKAAMKQDKVTAMDAAISAVEVAQEIQQNQQQEQPEYCFPPIDLLKAPAKGGADGTEEMRENSRRLNETLASFKIDAHIINVTRGPSVTRYEVELDKGVRLNKLTGCADDIALSLGAPSVRIAAVPGKISIVGIEVPNRAVTTVSLREVIDSPEFHKSKSKSSFAVGKDIGGSCIIGNIAKMPHMLIAGTTGSGKSVCMNSIIISLLYKAGPEDVKLIMIDPKMVELANYNGIPHLMIPVVTDPKKAAGSLQWAVTEMMRRYKTMSDAGVRDLESFNSIIVADGGAKIPQLVVIIDELADLMLVAAKEVEDSICRIAQMGRAAGIHLVIATQRPSADVITGLMKANIPSRIAFSVASSLESRIILDTHGAEKLVGKGDMLFAPIGAGKPHRVQGCFVTDSEVEAVTSYVKENYNADYNQQVLKEIEKNAAQTGKKPAATASDPEPNAEELDGDEMLPQAVEVILETQQASVSMLQRRLKLGYARAARIVDEMEEKGYVGPFQGSKPRTILITKEAWEARKAGADVQMTMDDLSDSGVPEDLPF